MDISVAFFMYNRPDLTERVLAAIALAKPERLLIVADGPRDEQDAERCRRTRSVAEQIDWPCDVERNYADTNLGCRIRVATGLDWVFSQVEEAIIVEDDCLPDASFFAYCAELLDYYRDDHRVGHISGNNIGHEVRGSPYSYFFSRYGGGWGWAAWRRVHEGYDVDMKIWPEVKAAGRHYDMFQTREEALFFEAAWDGVYEGRIDTWDLQWLFCRLVRGQFSVTPNVNLVSNIGFNTAATHTADSGNVRANQPTGQMEFPLRHPPYMICDRDADRTYAELEFVGNCSKTRRVMGRLVNRHFYGQLLRTTPVLGPWWARWRRACIGAGR